LTDWREVTASTVSKAIADGVVDRGCTETEWDRLSDPNRQGSIENITDWQSLHEFTVNTVCYAGNVMCGRMRSYRTEWQVCGRGNMGTLTTGGKKKQD
jgi:hypothetical protein